MCIFGNNFSFKIKIIMETTNIDKVIYQLTIEDLQNVANEELERVLTESEIKILEEKIGDYIDWYGAIQNAISDTVKFKVKTKWDYQDNK